MFSINERVAIRPGAESIFHVIPESYTGVVNEVPTTRRVRVLLDGGQVRTFQLEDVMKITRGEPMVTMAQIKSVASAAIDDHGHSTFINGIVDGLRHGHWVDNLDARPGERAARNVVSLDTGETVAVFFTNIDARAYRATLPPRTEVPYAQVDEHVRRIASRHGWCSAFEPYLARLSPTHPNTTRLTASGATLRVLDVKGHGLTVSTRVDHTTGHVVVNVERPDPDIKVQFTLNGSNVGQPA